jgi:hypothetical protein
LQEIARRYGRGNPIKRCAPTGVAAYGINGCTIHSEWKIPVKGPLKDLFSSSLITAQINMRSCQYIVIDKKSMVSLKLLAYIDRRLKQIRPNAAKKPFGGLNIILFGDFFQLPSVIEKALYSGAPRSNEYVRTGRKLYLSFNRTVELDVIIGL